MAVNEFAKATRDVATNSVHAGAEKVAISTGTVVGGVGVTAALSAGIAQMEYENKKRDIKDLYKEEIAAQLGKSEQQVKAADVDVMAKGNRTLSEQLGKEKKQRNVNIGVIFAATMVAIAITLLAAPGIGAYIAASGPVSFIAKALVAALSYRVAKQPIQQLGDKLFKMDYKTSHERIEDIHRDHEEGKTISRERVLSVFVHANPELDQFIIERYGKPFDALSVPDKVALTESIGDHLNVRRIADDINHGRIKATELAFAVDGTMSGVLRRMGEEPKHTVLNTIKQKLVHTAEVFSGYAPQSHAKEEERAETISERGHQHRRMSHVEREMQRRMAAAEASQGRS